MDGPENTVEAREDSMRLQLAGGSAAVTAAEAAVGLAEAQRELAGDDRYVTLLMRHPLHLG